MNQGNAKAEKWNFLVMLIVCGIFYMAFVDPERIYAAPIDELYTWVREKVTPTQLPVDSEEMPAENIEAAEPGKPEDSRLVTAGDYDHRENPGEAENSGPVSEPETVPETVPEETVPEYREPAEIVYTSVEDDYFADALFIGDSRTVGMFEYGGLEDISTFFAEKGLTIYKLLETMVKDPADPQREITIEQALSEKQYAKIYLMVGINEMGTGTPETFLEKYAEVVKRIQELQPGAILYVQGILKVTTERSDKGDYINNEGIEVRNEGLTQIVDNVTSYYLDVNPIVCDDTGGMEPSYTFDGVHLKAQYIQLWKDFLKTHVVENIFAKDSMEVPDEEYSVEE